ncbi:MAG: hypothetical protein WB762_19785 [Candidatus Sulfotelmatobacter sp.]
MKRILLVSSLIVPSVLFGMERSLIYLWCIAATIALCGLFAVTRWKHAHQKDSHSRARTEQERVGTKKQENIAD